MHRHEAEGSCFSCHVPACLPDHHPGRLRCAFAVGGVAVVIVQLLQIHFWRVVNITTNYCINFCILHIKSSPLRYIARMLAQIILYKSSVGILPSGVVALSPHPACVHFSFPVNGPPLNHAKPTCSRTPRDLATAITAPEDTAIGCAHNTRIAKLDRVPSNRGEAATNQGSFPPSLRFPCSLPYTTAKTDQRHPFLPAFKFGLEGFRLNIWCVWERKVRLSFA